MRKKFGIALVLALVATMTLGGTALAWEIEDPCVADNDDFLGAGGLDVDYWAFEVHPGNQLFGWGDGYNLYQADVSGLVPQNLDLVGVATLTPGAIDLPHGFPFWFFWVEWDAAKDLYYFALEPRGYNVGVGDAYGALAGKFVVDMYSYTNYQTYDWVEGWRGKTLAEPVFQSATFYYNGSQTIYTLEIPEGTVIEGYYGGRVQDLAFTVRDGEYHFSPNLKLSNPATLYEARVSDGVAEAMREVLTFTEVVDGKAS